MKDAELNSIEEALGQHLEIIRDIARLEDPGEFILHFMKECQTARTYEEAYHKTEQLYKWLFRETKYSSYNSFRNVKSRRMKNNTGRKID